MGTSTPWGTSDHSKVYAKGIIFYGTPGHGGLHLSKTRQAEMPAALRLDNGKNGEGWYEEDCDWARVALAFPQHFSTQEAEGAESTLRSYFPESWEAHYGRELKPGESRAKDRVAFYAAHTQDFLVRAAWGDWHENVPKGHVGLSARRKSDGAEAYFLVTKAEYDAPRDFDFIIASSTTTWVGPDPKQGLARSKQDERSVT